MPGFPEMVVIVAVALLLFGPEKMPEIGRAVGKALRELQKMRNEIMEGWDSEHDSKR